MADTWSGRSSGRGEGFVLGLLLGGTGQARKSGTHGRNDDLTDISLYIEQAKQAEAGKIHTIFLADSLVASEKAPRPGLEPVTLLSALATRTSHIGLVASVSTSFTEPYNVARQILSLDHISGGRAGWNLVTSSAGERNFGKELPAHDDRYAIASEFAEVVRALWESWDPDAVSYDGEGRQIVAPDKVRRIDWRSEHYAVEGPLNLSRSPQDRPILAQAGSSPKGKELGARVADVIFTTGLTEIEPSIRVLRDYKTLAQAHGRSPERIKVLPGVAPVIGSTDEEARRHWEKMIETIDFEEGRQSLAGQFGGIDLEGVDLDAPIPLDKLPQTEAIQGRQSRFGVFRKLIESGQVRTVRDLIIYHSSGAGHWFPIGSVENVADQLQERYERGAADGFNILAFTLKYDLGLSAITDHLIPELQRRGVYHQDYAHNTLRGNLGLQEA
ncbi:NtaA/DmoA family FMN-dependent monooxygenase [Neomegalonema sp.]|uniref:NtaA/DmoA family FMN-dependent monooxygenase n=1 Tax=Neomegalonema sp. TaxID=2039713 RepID=UPI0026112C5C|nr:NtaA/DmoA family FMN-dependent monooxygenase [Neomegalonema sp.]MDD2867381.1 NtaA/DmoA family FMN-dependent monooxygenase [Neomegalonema sp.]